MSEIHAANNNSNYKHDQKISKKADIRGEDEKKCGKREREREMNTDEVTLWIVYYL